MQTYWLYVLIKDLIYIIITAAVIGVVSDLSKSLASIAESFAEYMQMQKDSTLYRDVLLGQDETTTQKQ